MYLYLVKSTTPTVCYVNDDGKDMRIIDGSLEQTHQAPPIDKPRGYSMVVSTPCWMFIRYNMGLYGCMRIDIYK